MARYRERSEPANPFDDLRPKKMAQPYSEDGLDSQLEMLEKGIMNTGTGLRPKGQIPPFPEHMANEARKDELDELGRQRREAERIAELTQPQPVPQATSTPYPRRVTTTKVEEDMAPFSSGSGQGYGEEGGPANPQLVDPDPQTVALYGQASQSQQIPQRGPAPNPYEEREDYTANQALMSQQTDGRDTSPLPGVLGARHFEEERANYEVVREEVKDTETGYTQTRGYIRSREDYNPNYPYPDAQTAGRVNPMFGGTTGRMEEMTPNDSGTQAEESVESPDLEKPGQYVPSNDGSHQSTFQPYDALDTVTAANRTPPGKIAASPGRSGSSGSYRILSLSKPILLKSNKKPNSWVWVNPSIGRPLLFKSADGKAYPHIIAIASSTTEDRDGDVMAMSALKSMEQAANQRMTVFLDHEHSIPTSLGFVEKAWIEGNKLWVDIKLEDPELNPQVKSILHKMEMGERIGLSIGGDMTTGGYHIESLDLSGGSKRIIDDVKLYEISLVGLPSNVDSYALGVEYKAATATWVK